MKKYFLLIVVFLFTLSISFAQRSSRNDEKFDMSYTGKRYDSYGKPLDKKVQNKKKVRVEESHNGEYKNKAYPIGMDKDKRKRKSNFKGKKKKKGCDCPGK